jgi:hypothetical protein
MKDSLIAIQFNSISLCKDQFKNILTSLVPAQVQELDFTDCGLDQAAGNSLNEVITAFTALEILKLPRNKLNRSIQNIFKLTSSFPLKMIDFSNN